jgi:hypothetical protein
LILPADVNPILEVRIKQEEQRREEKIMREQKYSKDKITES